MWTKLQTFAKAISEMYVNMAYELLNKWKMSFGLEWEELDKWKTDKN